MLRPPRGVLAALGALFIAAGILVFVPYGGSGGIVFEVRPGEGAGIMAQRLLEAGVILDGHLFRGVVFLRGAGRRLQAGVYELDGRQSVWGLVSLLVEGRTRLARLTIPEGYASWQVARRLESRGVCSAAGFLEAVRQAGAEGTLFPQTYHLAPGTNPRAVVSIMTAEFEKTWARDLASSGLPGGLDRHGAVTLASIVEREARRDFERPLVSAVFLNRLRRGWLLESCATVQYALGFWKSRLSNADLRVDSEYNTYLHPGLPPGPICNPGLASLKAVFSPAETDALFFIADGQGTHSFFTSYKEHAAEKLHRKKKSSKLKVKS